MSGLNDLNIDKITLHSHKFQKCLQKSEMGVLIWLFIGIAVTCFYFLIPEAFEITTGPDN